MHTQNPCANTTVSGASDGPTSRTANGTPSAVGTTLARSKSRSVKSSVACGSWTDTRLPIERAAATPARVPTAASPATPAIQRASLNRPRRGCSPLANRASFAAFFATERARRSSIRCARLGRRDASSLNGSALTVDAGDPAARTGDHLVVDGVERFRPVLSRRLAVSTGAEEDRSVALAHAGLAGSEVDDELVHADPADVGPPAAVDQHVEAAAQSPVHPVGVPDRHQRQRRVAIGDPNVTVRHPIA